MLDALWLWPCFFSALLVSCPFSLSPVIGVNSNQVL
jgi:hypothetical protein